MPLIEEPLLVELEPIPLLPEEIEPQSRIRLTIFTLGQLEVLTVKINADGPAHSAVNLGGVIFVAYHLGQNTQHQKDTFESVVLLNGETIQRRKTSKELDALMIHEDLEKFVQKQFGVVPIGSFNQHQAVEPIYIYEV